MLHDHYRTRRGNDASPSCPPAAASFTTRQSSLPLLSFPVRFVGPDFSPHRSAVHRFRVQARTSPTSCNQPICSRLIGVKLGLRFRSLAAAAHLVGVGIAARLKHTLSDVQEHVVPVVFANHQVDVGVVGAIFINVMHFGLVGERASKSFLGDDNVFEAIDVWRANPDHDVASSLLSPAAPAMMLGAGFVQMHRAIRDTGAVLRAALLIFVRRRDRNFAATGTGAVRNNGSSHTVHASIVNGLVRLGGERRTLRQATSILSPRCWSFPL
jgi:hypothetical protein